MTSQNKPTAATQLRGHGMKSTYARQCILQILQFRKQPLSVAEVHALAGKAHHPPSLVTVYRILEAFEQKGIVHRHPCDGKYMLCGLPDSRESHGFLHCLKCGRLEEVLLPAIGKFLHSLSSTKRFHPSQCMAEVHGTCAKCA